jgi:acyl-CoA dehydrogenase
LRADWGFADVNLITDQIEKMIARHAARPMALWDEIAESGYLGLLVPEDQGGAGAALREVFPLAFVLGRSGVDLPVVETMIARSLVGPSAPSGPIVLSDGRWWQADVRSRALVLGEDRDGVFLRKGGAGVHLQASTLRAMAAAVVAGRMAGAMQAICDMTIAYAQVRQQFGREIARFQAVQHLIAVMAEEATAASMAASAGFTSLPDFCERRAMVAKLRACQAADIVVATGHAVHGAIGVSGEYELGGHAARLRAWSAAYGGRSYWESKLGSLVLKGGSGFLDAVRFEPTGS